MGHWHLTRWLSSRDHNCEYPRAAHVFTAVAVRHWGLRVKCLEVPVEVPSKRVL